MKKIERFTNQYSLSKTLKFKLLPVGNTLQNFKSAKVLESDEKKAKDYIKVKKIMDDYHRDYIENAFSSFENKKAFLDHIKEYSDFYNKSDKDSMRKKEESLRKEVAEALTTSPFYSKLFKEKMISEILPEYLEKKGDTEGKKYVEEFKGFSVYFSGFFTNRKNMYSSGEESTAIAYRCINENLPKFLDNVHTFNKVREKLGEKIKVFDKDFNGIYSTKTADVFSTDYFPFVLSQKGIDRYNSIIGGYTNADGTKIPGLNEYINLYNQTAEKSERIPKLKRLYKQILGDGQTISFIPEKFSNDDELLMAIKEYYAGRDDEGVVSIEKTVSEIIKLFRNINDYNPNGIYIEIGLPLTDACNGAFGYWKTVQNQWNNEYDLKNGYKDTQKYADEREKAYKALGSFSLADIQFYADAAQDKNLLEWLTNTVTEKCDAVNKSYSLVKKLIDHPYTNSKKLYNNDEAIDLIKNALDALKELEHALDLVKGTGKESEKDECFYGEFWQHYERLHEVDKLYDKVRNYMTQKPYKTDKIKLNFENPQFLGGWDRNKESDYSAVLLRKEGKYYVAVMAKDYKKSFENIPQPKDNEEIFEKVVYKLLPGPNKMLPKVFFSKRWIKDKKCSLSGEIEDIYEKETYKGGKNFNIEDCRKLIDYFKSSIDNYSNWSEFGFRFSDTSCYNNIAEFYNEVKNQGYKISFCKVPLLYIDSLVAEGKVYLFQIYNKDFSEFSRGTPNLHTLYFKMLFDETNLEHVVFKLNGESEMFYRKASINEQEKIVHPKNQPVKNKNKENVKKESVFAYDLIKDKRYTDDQFAIHIPITLNFTAADRKDLNFEVKKALKECDDNYVIGIDRGERNLLYICVINSKGEIVEQYSLNEIVNEYNGNAYKTDYHALLEEREKDRKKSRESWKSVESIKELKEGYISQVVHKICDLVEKYDAVIAMEDLNLGFKRVRDGKFERSVYEKFEKMLIDKLNYCADKKRNVDEVGSILHAYQLTNKFESFKKMGKQNGFIFYIPAWLTSKIDPTTGFADLMHPRYESVDSSRNFIEKFDSIGYNADGRYFEFAFDYGKFDRCDADYKKKWTICTYGERIETFRNPDKNGTWDNRTVDLTKEMFDLFKSNGINVEGNIRQQILEKSDKEFFYPLIRLIKLTLQMRNSETGNVDRDYLISPVKSADGKFYNSDDYKNLANARLPKDADANGAYNIARKALWAMEQFKNCKTDAELKNTKLAMTNAQWLEYVQKV